MTAESFVGFIADHWVILGLILCPIVVVLMALAALSCEACGAPFGIFRRRNRTIDLCLRCALIHDIRHGGKDARATQNAAGSAPATAEREGTRADRRFRNTPPAGLGVAGSTGTH